jgi:hypothetical protein
MKYLIFLFVFIFVGCTQKTTQTTIPSTSYNSAVNIQKNNTKVQTTVPVDQLNNKDLEKNNTIAIVYPSVNIGKYALEATNTINMYLLYKQKSFSIETYDMFLQSKKNIIKTFEQIQSKGITKVIAMITSEQLYYLNSVPNISNLNIYLPLINKTEVINPNQLENLNVTFGGISYENQFKKLFAHSNRNKLVEFYDNTKIGSFLHSFLESQKVSYSRVIDDNNGRYTYFLKNNRYINNSSIVLNTPIVKSSILLSSITAEELTPSMILSTQLNYTPLIFSLTQRMDRRKLVVANSIGTIPLELIEYNEILGNSITYNWVNYSAIIGAELLTSNSIDFFNDLKIEDNQVLYPVNLYEVRDHSFSLIK